MKRFLVSNRLEIFSVMSLFIIFCTFAFFSWGHLGSTIIDCDREAYFPAEILKGKILYRDLFNIFGPFSYLINAFCYKFMGINFSTLYVVGFLNSGLILATLYFLMRLFTSRDVSWSVTFFVMSTCAFSPWVFNYAFPYAYALTYAFGAFLLSVLFLMSYLKTSKQFFIPISWFFIGISVASKYEYLLYVIFLAFLTIFVAKLKKKHIILSAISFLIVPIICFSILFSQGLTLQDLLSQMLFVKQFALSSSLNYFYSNATGLYPQKAHLILALEIFAKVFSCIMGVLISSYTWLNLKKDNRKNFKWSILSFGLISFFCYQLFAEIIEFYRLSFVWLPFVVACIFLVVLLSSTRRVGLKNYLVSKDGIYLVFVFISILAATKSFFYLNLKAYGTFALPLLLASASIFVVEFLPSRFSSINKTILKKTFCILLLPVNFIFVSILILGFKNQALITTNKGIIYDSKNIAETLESATSYINKKMDSSASFIVMPEGVILNFLTDHSSNTIYYSVMSPYIDAFGEDKIVGDIKKNPPDYIFITNRDATEYGKAHICKDFGLEICEYVKSSYLPIETFGKGFKMTLYKRISD